MEKRAYNFHGFLYWPEPCPNSDTEAGQEYLEMGAKHKGSLSGAGCVFAYCGECDRFIPTHSLTIPAKPDKK